MEKNENNGLIVIIAFLLGLIIGMFVSPINGISIGNNNKITGDKRVGPCDDDDYDEDDEEEDYSF